MIRLNKREKHMVAAVVGCFLLFTVIQFLVFPLIDKREQLRRVLAVNTDRLAEIRSLAAEFTRTRKQTEAAQKQAAAREKGFSLFSFLEKTAGQTRLKERIAYMKPSTASLPNSPYEIDSVEMKLQSITLAELVAYLHRVETAKHLLHLKRLSIIRNEKSQGLITATLEIESYKI